MPIPPEVRRAERCAPCVSRIPQDAQAPPHVQVHLTEALVDSASPISALLIADRKACRDSLSRERVPRLGFLPIAEVVGLGPLSAYEDPIPALKRELSKVFFNAASFRTPVTDLCRAHAIHTQAKEYF